jgi:hypothetical protein
MDTTKVSVDLQLGTAFRFVVDFKGCALGNPYLRAAVSLAPGNADAR